MDFSILRAIVFGAFDGLQRASETVVSRVFTSAFSINRAVQGTAHGAVDIVFSLTRSVLRVMERAAVEVLALVFTIGRAVVGAAIDRPTTTDATAQEDTNA